MLKQTARSLASILVAFTPMLAIAAEPNPVDDAACNAIVATLPPLGTRLSAKTIDQVIAELPGSVLELKPSTPKGLVLQSTYAGTLNCQRNSLSQATQSGREQVAILDRFQGGEGALCGPDKVQLVTVAGTPALLEIAGDDSQVDLDIAQQAGIGWRDPCRLSIEMVPHYGLAERFCSDDTCQALGRIAVQVADFRRGADTSKQALAVDQLTTADQAKWDEIQKLAETRQLLADELPTFGQVNTNGSLRSFLDWDTVLLPIPLNGKLLLGKAGTAGFGSHFGSDQLFAAYRQDGDQLQPVAGFYLTVAARSLSGYHVAPSP